MATVLATDQSLEAIYARALALAADRLDKIDDDFADIDFDRGTRSARSLVLIAKEVNALQSRLDKDASHDATETDLTPPTDEELGQFRREVLARLERNHGGKDQPDDGECPVEGTQPGDSTT